jgi:hypothetical protein
MALSINPLAQLITSSSESGYIKSHQRSSGSLPQVGDALSKANLDATISRLSGEIGSGLNGLTAGTGSAFGTLLKAEPVILLQVREQH